MTNNFSIINPHNYIHVMPKNSVKIGCIGKKLYVAHLIINEVTTTEKVEREEILTVHTLRTKEGEVIEKFEGKLAKDLFMRMLFY